MFYFYNYEYDLREIIKQNRPLSLVLKERIESFELVNIHNFYIFFKLLFFYFNIVFFFFILTLIQPNVKIFSNRDRPLSTKLNENP